MDRVIEQLRAEVARLRAENAELTRRWRGQSTVRSVPIARPTEPPEGFPASAPKPAVQSGPVRSTWHHIRYADFDSQHPLHNTRFPELFEEARAAIGRAERLEWTLVVTAHLIAYRRLVRYSSSPLEIRTWVEGFGTCRVVVGQELYNDRAELAAKITTWLAPCDPVTERPRRLTGEEREVLLRWLR